MSPKSEPILFDDFEYSPELNPCELVFGKIKNYLRYHREPYESMWVSIMKSITLVTNDNLRKFYQKCLYSF